jgi:5'/3'-nucleotidase SurE
MPIKLITTLVLLSLVDLARAEPLRILLTNDDGFDSPGITAMQKALTAAGHDVILVAPLNNQSGSGMRVSTTGVLDYQEQSAGIWSVDGSPADAVLVGLLHVMKDDLPDVVVSGANFGPNLGYAYSSGTLGAATMAMYVGVPAIALSVGVNPAEYAEQPYPFPSTFAAFDGAADLAVDLLADLQAASEVGSALLPDKTVLNINYPPLSVDNVQGIRIAPATWDAGVRIAYAENDDDESGQLHVQLKIVEAGNESDSDADWQWLARGYITVTVLDADSDAGSAARGDLARRLSLID